MLHEGATRNASTDTGEGDTDIVSAFDKFTQGGSEPVPHTEADARTDVTEGTYFSGNDDNWSMPTFLQDSAAHSSEIEVLDSHPGPASLKDSGYGGGAACQDPREQTRCRPMRAATQKVQRGDVLPPQFWYETDLCYICKHRVYYFSQSACCAVPAHDSCVQAFRRCHVCGRRGRHEAQQDSEEISKRASGGGCCCAVS